SSDLTPHPTTPVKHRASDRLANYSALPDDTRRMPWLGSYLCTFLASRLVWTRAVLGLRSSNSIRHACCEESIWNLAMDLCRRPTHSPSRKEIRRADPPPGSSPDSAPKAH